MRFLRRASSFLNNLKSSSDGSNLISSIGRFLSKISLLHIGLFAIPVIIILIIFLTLMSLFNYKINLLQMVDNGEAYSSSSSSLVAGDHMSIVEAAKTQLGQPYCYTGSVADPGGCGFNCSGLTWWAYEKAGYKIPHAQGYRSESFGFNGENSQAYWVHSKGHWKNNIDECYPGDLVFFSHSGTWKVTYHVGIYMGDHKMIHSGGSGVHISDYNSSGNFVGCGWPLEYDSYSGGKLDFSCKSDKVKADFSCDTLKIVENHLYDLNADNFYDVINSYGGFENYAKSVGGIFGTYYGKKITGRTEHDFQMAAEYVLGWMYMYGWDYKNGFGANEGEHVKWGGRGNDYSPDAFYYKTKNKWKSKFVRDPGVPVDGRGVGTDFDHVISGKNGGVGAMASECGDLNVFTNNKLGISTSNIIAKPSKMQDLKVGDNFYMWNSNGGGHNVVVGEVYSDHIVFYDGSYLVTSGEFNYKRTLWIPKVYSHEAEIKALRETFKYFDNWAARRYYNYTK